MVTGLSNFIDIIGEVVKEKQRYQQNALEKLPIDVMSRWSEMAHSSKDKERLSDIYSFVDSYSKMMYDYYSGEKRRNRSGKHRYFYRGQSSIDYNDKLCPGIYRKTEKHGEYYYLNNMMVRCPLELMKLNSVSKLTFLQHYGCPTRLLDVTLNPLVSLFFACEKDDDKDGTVFAFVVNEDDVLFGESDKVLMLSKLAELKEKEQENLRYLAYFWMIKNKFPQKPQGKYINNDVERFYHSITMEYPAFERLIDPIDLLRPVFVQTALDNPRILKQDGAFLMCGLDTNEDDSNRKIKQYVCREITVPASNKKRIREELEMVGITQASLFPEVDKVASYLKEKE